jgi:hypothetical protein
MNTYTIALSSNTTSHIETFPEITLEDYTSMTINLEDLTTRILPIRVTIDWGDKIEVYDKNNIYYNTSLTNNSIDRPLFGDYSHEYPPSSSSLYKRLSAQVLVNYSNGNYSWFIIPIKIRTYDYFESIGDLSLTNTNILPIEGNLKEHQFITSIGGYAIEMRQS